MLSPQGPVPPAAPTFWQTVWGTVLGNLGCLLAYLVLLACVMIPLLAFMGQQVGNVFSRITSGLSP